MSDDSDKKITDWDGEYDKPELGTEGAKLLDRLEAHKETLLSHLRDNRVGDSKVRLSDGDRPTWQDLAWYRIKHIAHIYQGQGWYKRKVGSDADRKARCRKLAKTLSSARAMIDNGICAPDLTRAWLEGIAEHGEAGKSSIDLIYPDLKFSKALEGLIALETAARRAAETVRTERGRPQTSVLSRVNIYALADVYRGSTGSKPGAGAGPFARFVTAFCSAIGHHTEFDTVIDAIKDARTHLLQNPNEGDASPFDGEPAEGKSSGLT